MDSDYGSYPVLGHRSSDRWSSWECGSAVLPMTADVDLLEQHIEDLDASGDTYIAPGLMWGYRLLSPGAPFTEMAGKDIEGSAIVLMSDGMNSRSYRVDDGIPDHAGGDTDEANEDTLAACEFIKANDVEIYAIAFKIEDKDTEDMLKECATSFSHYYDANSASQLKKAFSDVAQSFSEVALAE